MMMLCSVITPMTRDATLLTSQTMSLSRRRSARRTSGKTASLNMRRLLLMRLLLSAEPLWSRTVISRDLKYVELSMSLSAGPSKRFMMLRMRRSVKMKLQATPPTPSAPSGLRRSALYPRSQSRSSLPSPDVPRSQGRSVLLLVVDSRKELRNVTTKSKLLSRMPLRNSVLLSPSVPASMSPRRSAPGQEPTQGRSRSQLSRNGAMSHQRSLDLPKSKLIFQTPKGSNLLKTLQYLTYDLAYCSIPETNLI